MASYSIEWKRSAKKEVKKLPKSVIVKIISTVEKLSFNPYPNNSVKLAGTDHSYRIRLGDYRLIYNAIENVLTVEVIRVGHRKNVYRNILK